MENASEKFNVALLCYDGVDELDLLGAFSVLRKAADILASSRNRTNLNVYLSGLSRTILGSAGLEFSSGYGREGLAVADIVIIPGGKGVKKAAEDSNLLLSLANVIDRGGSLYGVCSGSTVIAATERASHARLAIHKNKREELLNYPIGGTGSGLIHDGNIITVGGDISQSVKSVDLAFYIVSRIAPDLINALSERLEIMPGRNGNRGNSSAVTVAEGNEL